MYEFLSFQNSQKDIQEYVAENGPVAASLYFDPMYNYSSGVWFDKDDKCGRNKANHSLTIVGYGVDKSTPSRPIKYWLLKNNYGTHWGEDGYIRIIREDDGKGVCQLTRYCYAPDIY